MRARHLLTAGTLATFLTLAGGPSGLAQEQLPAGDASLSSQSVPAQVTFHVPTMSCPGCGYRVDGSIRQAPGILDVAVAGQDVTVTYDPSVVTPEAIEAAIEVVGDVAEPLEG